MIFSELKYNTEFAIKELMASWQGSDFVTFYSNLLSLHRKYFEQVKSENINEKQLLGHHQTFNEQVKSLVINTDLGSLFVSLHELKAKINAITSNSPLLAVRSKEIQKRIEELWNNLNALMRAPHNYPQILQIIRLCEEFDKNFVYFQNCSSFFTECDKLLSPDLEIKDGESKITLYFYSSNQHIAIFTNQLAVLQSLYSEVCFIFDVNEQSFPLKIEKIESGTLFSKLIGDSKVIEFISWFLKNSIKFLHRTYTTEGKISKIPTNIAALEKILAVHEKLKIMNPEKFKELQDEQAEHLHKSMVLIAKGAQTLLEKETKIKIDDETIELNVDDTTLYLEATKQLPNLER